VPLPELNAAEQRVLGSLLEKEITVPSTYPMTVNALRSACNQSSSREPVVEYEERFVHDTLRALKERDLVAVTWEDRGRRTMKYLQRLSVLLDLQADERALLTVLLLRGAQPPGALRSRTERLHLFHDRAEVEACLTALAARPEPLVRELPRRAREQDNRWVHLLGPVESTTEAEEPAADTESILAAGVEARDARVRASYGAVAGAYAGAFAEELEQLPFERWLLARVADLAGPHPVVEVGCGPGHVTAHLASLGVDATGVDLTPEMVEEARRRFPDGTYQVGDLRQLMRPANDDGWGAVLGWYSLIHLAESELPSALSALTRPLRPGGWLAIALHAGAGIAHHDSWFDQAIDLDFVSHGPAEIRALVDAAGLTDVEWYLRGPNLARGESTERLYVLGRRA